MDGQQNQGRLEGTPIHILGMGLAGCCLAWQRYFRGEHFTWEDDDRPGSASRVAAGLVNPVTGKNFSVSWRLAEFLPEAEAFYERVGGVLGKTLWFPLPVWRLVGEKEWPKVEGKLEEARPWMVAVDEQVPGWRAAVVLKGGGRVATREFCEGTRDFFPEARRLRNGLARDAPATVLCDGTGEIFPEARRLRNGLARDAPATGGRTEGLRQDAAATVLCEGAAGLVAGRLGGHRCAKGEILTLRAPAWRADRILIGGGGWLVPLGDGMFKAGSTYVWDRLDAEPTPEGLARVEEIARLLGGADFEVTAHEAGVRPIVRKSQPVIGPLDDGRIVFNGLGSKGSLYAPGVAGRLAAWLVGETELDPELDVRLL